MILLQKQQLPLEKLGALVTLEMVEFSTRFTHAPDRGRAAAFADAPAERGAQKAEAWDLAKRWPLEFGV